MALTSQEESDEEYDDPIRLVDVEPKSTNIQDNKQSLDYDAVDSDGEVLIEKEVQQDCKTGVVTNPVTIFSESRKQKLPKCRPFSIKVVDCNKYKWYYKKYFKPKNETTQINDCSTTNVTGNKITSENFDEEMRFKIHPVSTPYNNLQVHISLSKHTQKKENKAPIDWEEVKQKALTARTGENVDLKKNQGLIGLRIAKNDDSEFVKIHKKDKHANSKVVNKSDSKKQKEKSSKVLPLLDSKKRKEKSSKSAKVAEPEKQNEKLHNSLGVKISECNIKYKDVKPKTVTKLIAENPQPVVPTIQYNLPKDILVKPVVPSNQKEDVTKLLQKNPPLEILPTRCNLPKDINLKSVSVPKQKQDSSNIFNVNQSKCESQKCTTLNNYKNSSNSSVKSNNEVTPNIALNNESHKHKNNSLKDTNKIKGNKIKKNIDGRNNKEMQNVKKNEETSIKSTSKQSSSKGNELDKILYETKKIFKISKTCDVNTKDKMPCLGTVEITTVMNESQLPAVEKNKGESSQNTVFDPKQNNVVILDNELPSLKTGRKKTTSNAVINIQKISPSISNCTDLKQTGSAPTVGNHQLTSYFIEKMPSQKKKKVRNEQIDTLTQPAKPASRSKKAVSPLRSVRLHEIKSSDRCKPNNISLGQDTFPTDSLANSQPTSALNESQEQNTNSRDQIWRQMYPNTSFSTNSSETNPTKNKHEDQEKKLFVDAPRRSDSKKQKCMENKQGVVPNYGQDSLMDISAASNLSQQILNKMRMHKTQSIFVNGHRVICFKAKKQMVSKQGEMTDTNLKITSNANQQIMHDLQADNSKPFLNTKQHTDRMPDAVPKTNSPLTQYMHIRMSQPSETLGKHNLPFTSIPTRPSTITGSTRKSPVNSATLMTSNLTRSKINESVPYQNVNDHSDKGSFISTLTGRRTESLNMLSQINSMMPPNMSQSLGVTTQNYIQPIYDRQPPNINFEPPQNINFEHVFGPQQNINFGPPHINGQTPQNVNFRPPQNMNPQNVNGQTPQNVNFRPPQNMNPQNVNGQTPQNVNFRPPQNMNPQNVNGQTPQNVNFRPPQNMNPQNVNGQTQQNVNFRPAQNINPQNVNGQASQSVNYVNGQTPQNVNFRPPQNMNPQNVNGQIPQNVNFRPPQNMNPQNVNGQASQNVNFRPPQNMRPQNINGQGSQNFNSRSSQNMNFTNVIFGPPPKIGFRPPQNVNFRSPQNVNFRPPHNVNFGNQMPYNCVPWSNQYRPHMAPHLPPPPPPPPPPQPPPSQFPQPITPPLQPNQLHASMQNLSPQLSSSIKGTTVIGQNNSGPITKINITNPSLVRDDTILNEVDENITPVNSKSEMLLELSKAVALSPVKGDLKRPHSVTEAPPEVPKLINEAKRPRPGPLSKKPKEPPVVPTTQTVSVNKSQNPQISSPQHKKIANTVSSGYSPPILPIPTYEKTFEILAKAAASVVEDISRTFQDNTENFKEPVGLKCNENFKIVESEVEKQDRLSKKISLDEYKKRIPKSVNNNESEVTFNFIKKECKTENPETDLGYDSDSTVRL